MNKRQAAKLSREVRREQFERILAHRVPEWGLAVSSSAFHGMGPGNQRALWRIVDDSMRGRLGTIRGVTSRSGVTAYLSICWCRMNGYEFEMRGTPCGYYVERKDRVT